MEEYRLSTPPVVPCFFFMFLSIGVVAQSEWGGVGLVWRFKDVYSKKLCTTLENLRTPSQGIVKRDFSRFEETDFFDYTHSAPKCIKYSFQFSHSRVHSNPMHCLSFPTSDRLEVWLKSSGTSRSWQYHVSRTIWRILPLSAYHLPIM